MYWCGLDISWASFVWLYPHRMLWLCGTAKGWFCTSFLPTNQHWKQQVGLGLSCHESGMHSVSTVNWPRLSRVVVVHVSLTVHVLQLTEALLLFLKITYAEVVINSRRLDLLDFEGSHIRCRNKHEYTKSKNHHYCDRYAVCFIFSISSGLVWDMLVSLVPALAELTVLVF